MHKRWKYQYLPNRRRRKACKRAKSERNQCIESLLWVGVFAAAQFINKSKRNERKKIIFIIYVAFCVAWWWRGADNYMTKRRKEMISRFANAICVHNARRTRARQPRDQFEFKCVWCLYLHFSSLPIHAAFAIPLDFYDANNDAAQRRWCWRCTRQGMRGMEREAENHETPFRIYLRLLSYS